MPSLNEIRATYLNFFAADGHEKVHSAPLVPQNDPSLLFVNAGMVPFKDYFTGASKPPYPRATSSQKCVRAGGKHNDLDNVGYTARHLTFFEMLGNFSFGDYFKEHAIDRAWKLVTQDFDLDPKRLLVTVYIDDDEAAAIWKKVTGFSDDKIIRIAGSDNFWAMGDSGPCGPCTEIFWDHGDKVAGGPPGSPDEDGDRFVEIWNNVFMQFEKENDQIVRSLPKPSVDTGMGLERMTTVLQGVHSVFETDLFKTLIAASEEATSTKADGDQAASHRVIADHLRSSSFLIADGVTPSNEGRGYVLRRIMRRAMRHAHLLGAADPLMHRLVPTLVDQMGDAYPELARAQPFIEDTLKQEEVRFRTTLGRGMGLLEDASRDLGEGGVLSGQTAFTLYDTYGFPLDLTQDEARRRGFTVDTDAFDAAMNEQKARSREHEHPRTDGKQPRPALIRGAQGVQQHLRRALIAATPARNDDGMGINERLQAELGNDLHATCRVHWCGIDGDDAMRVPGEFELRAWQPEDLHGNAELECAEAVVGQNRNQTW